MFLCTYIVPKASSCVTFSVIFVTRASIVCIDSDTHGTMHVSLALTIFRLIVTPHLLSKFGDIKFQWCLFGAKPLSEPVLAYIVNEQIWVNKKMGLKILAVKWWPFGVNLNESFFSSRMAPGCRLNIKMPSCQYRNSHVNDKTVSPTLLSLTWEFPYLGKTVFILRWSPAFWNQGAVSI